MDDKEVWQGFAGVPAVLRGIEAMLDFLWIHGSQITERDSDLLEALENQYYSPGADIVSASNGAIHVKDKNTGRYGFADTKGKIVIPCEWDYGSCDNFSEGFVNLLDPVSWKWCYYDNKGNKLTEPIFSAAQPFSEGLASVGVGKLDGYIDQTGSMVIEAQYNKAGSFKNGLAVVKKDDEEFYIDKTGKKVMPYKYADLIKLKPVF